MSVFSQLLLTFSVVSSVALAAELAFHGPTLPPPHAVSQDADFVQSMKAMTAALHRVLNASSGSSEANSLAVMGWSVSDSDAAFEFYHTGAQVDGATSQVGPDSIFRIASISKLFTVYALLEQGGYDVLGEPITKYVPELKSDGYRDSNNVDWSEVTVGALASYMAGVARDCK